MAKRNYLSSRDLRDIRTNFDGFVVTGDETEEEVSGYANFRQIDQDDIREWLRKKFKYSKGGYVGKENLFRDFYVEFQVPEYYPDRAEIAKFVYSVFNDSKNRRSIISTDKELIVNNEKKRIQIFRNLCKIEN